MNRTLLRLPLLAMLLAICIGCISIQGQTPNSTHNAGTNPMVKDDLARRGLKLLLRSDPTFADELKKLGLDSSELQAKGLFPVLLRNSSLRSLAAVQIHWRLIDNSSVIWNPSFSFTQPRALLDGHLVRMEEASLPSNSTRLITVEGLILRPEQLHNMSSQFSSKPFSLVSVQIDSAVFDDGSVVGPDEDGLVARFRAMVDAQHDLMEEIGSQLAKGQSLHDVLAAMPHEDDKNVHSVAPSEFYRMIRQQILDEMIATEKNFGQEMAMRSFHYHRYEIRPDIHRIP